MERLALQVETLLRDWHLVHACDRYASFSDSENQPQTQMTRLIRSTAILGPESSPNTHSDLTLLLWDAPSSTSHDNDEGHSHIPLSLQR
eukprot:scaffold261352_cov33-Attheya_sp.AAC.1